MASRILGASSPEAIADARSSGRRALSVGIAAELIDPEIVPALDAELG